MKIAYNAKKRKTDGRALLYFRFWLDGKSHYAKTGIYLDDDWMDSGQLTDQAPKEVLQKIDRLKEKLSQRIHSAKAAGLQITDDLIDLRRSQRLDFDLQGLDDKAKVFLRSIPVPGAETSFVYFLIEGEEIIYIGSTERHLIKRIHEHLREKQFDRYSYMEVPKEDRAYYEVLLIRLYQPRMNLQQY